MSFERGDVVSVDGWPGVAFVIVGEETAPTPDTWWDGIEEPTGMLVAVMVGDDYRHSVDPANCQPISDGDYCASCGQMGCTHDGRSWELA
jgi:hypothetical protein